MNPLRRYVDWSNSLVGHERLKGRFQSYKAEYSKAGLPLVFYEYLSVVAVTVVLLFAISLLLIPSDILVRVLGAFLAASLCFFVMYIYPLERADSRKRRIEAELPLGLNYIAALLGSGAPPITAFAMLAEFREYEELSREAKKIARDCLTLGMDLPSALDREAENCPSKQLKEILKSLKSEIISGGNITQFFEEKARDRMAHYERQQREYEKSSDTLGNIYLVVALVAPLLFITSIAIIDFVNSSGVGDLMGAMTFSPDLTFSIFTMGVFVGIPLINIIFIIVVKMTQPEVV